MAFWSDTSLDPKRAFKFRVSFGRLADASNGAFLAQSADRPQYTVNGETAVDFLDKKFYFPGKVTWEPVKIKFVDAAGPVGVNVSKDSYKFLKDAGWISPSEVNVNGPASGNFATISKNQASRASGVVTVEVLDSTGGIVDSWSLKNAFITKVTLNGLNYTSEEILTAEYTFRYDWAELAGV